MGITDFYLPVNAQFDGGESEEAQISPQTLEAVPVPDRSPSDPDPPPPPRWVDPSNARKASQDARESWRPEREAREAFGVIAGVPN